MPKRIQRKRITGWKQPEGSIYVGRPTRWGNPFTAASPEGKQWAADQYGRWIADGEVLSWLDEQFVCPYALKWSLRWWLHPLVGKDLVCWCDLTSPCHADVLLKLANER